MMARGYAGVNHIPSKTYFELLNPKKEKPGLWLAVMTNIPHASYGRSVIYGLLVGSWS